MSNRNNPLNSFSRVSGRYGTMAPFFPTSGTQQSLTGDGQQIDVKYYNTKLYTTTRSFLVDLPNGVQDGQLKKVNFVAQGYEDTAITVDCPTLYQNDSKVLFTNVGDFTVFMWTGGSWIILETGNSTDPTLQTPVVN